MLVPIGRPDITSFLFKKANTAFQMQKISTNNIYKLYFEAYESGQESYVVLFTKYSINTS